jgi:choline dehydrogenase
VPVNRSFDTIVIGAGSAGCVVAARSAADGQQVLLLEAGPDYRAGELPEELRTLSLPVRWPHDWRDQVTSIRDRGLKYMRGRVTGGSSATNGSVALRAEPPDFDIWPRGWQWPDMLPYFCRIERDVDFGDRPWHGDSGPIPVVRWPRDTWSAMQSAYHDACVAVGFPACADHNEPLTSGIGAIPMNRVERRRQSNLLVYLEPARAYTNLTVRGDAHVRRIIIEHGRAVAVELVDGEQLRASEIVLSAGVVQNPLLLWRSGIGPAERVRGIGVESLVDLAAVGFNVTDHLVVSTFASIDEDALANTVHSIQTILRLSSTDSFRAHDLQLTPFGRRDENGQAELVQTVALQLPNGAGSITATSADPSDPPLISWPFAADADNVRRLREGWRTSLEIAGATGLVTDRPRLDADLSMSDADLDELIARDHTAFYHGVGSCRIGTDPSSSVVDPRCRVWHLDGLRVIDASVAPAVPRANTHLLATAIAERALDLVG